MRHNRGNDIPPERADDSGRRPRERRRHGIFCRFCVRLLLIALLAGAVYLLFESGVLGKLIFGNPVTISAEALVVRTREMGRMVTFEKEEQGTVRQQFALYYDVTLSYDYTLQAGIDFEQAQIDISDSARVIVYLPDAQIISESMTWGTKQFAGLSLGASLFDAQREQALKQEKQQEVHDRFLREDADEQGRGVLERAWDKAAQVVIAFMRPFTRDESVEIIALPLSSMNADAPQ